MKSKPKQTANTMVNIFLQMDEGTITREENMNHKLEVIVFSNK